MQNFVVIGRRNLEILWRRKENKPQQNINPLRKLLLPGGLTNKNEEKKFEVTSHISGLYHAVY